MRGKGATLAAGNRIDGPACDCEERTETQVGQRDTECPAPSISAPRGMGETAQNSYDAHFTSAISWRGAIEQSRTLPGSHDGSHDAAARVCGQPFVYLLSLREAGVR
jgi:hypothetical protein